MGARTKRRSTRGGRRNNKRAAVKKQTAPDILEDKKLEAEAKLVKAKTKLETVKVTAIYAQAGTNKAERDAALTPRPCRRFIPLVKPEIEVSKSLFIGCCCILQAHTLYPQLTCSPPVLTTPEYILNEITTKYQISHCNSAVKTCIR